MVSFAAFLQPYLVLVGHTRELRIDTAQLDVEARKPLMDNQGNLLSSAPRWFLEAAGMISRRRPKTDAIAA